MASGKLRHPITIERLEASRNDYGEEVGSWVPYLKTWAEIKPIKAGEFFSVRGVEHSVTHRVVTRHIDGVAPKMRILHEGRVFEIKAVRDYFERHAMLEILCEELDND